MNMVDLPPDSRCVLCGVVLMGAICWDQHRRVFCQRHRSEGRHCRYCDRFFLAAGGPSDTCGPCAFTQVSDATMARDTCDAACRWFVANGLRLPGAIPLRFSGAMPAAPHGSGSRMLGYTEQRAGLFRRSGESPPPTVVVLGGLPLTMLRMVLAHELGHVTLGRESLRLPRWAEEGSCDWLAHRYLGTFVTPDTALHRHRIETRDDPVYGDGFRWVAARMGARTPAELVPMLGAARLPHTAPVS